MDNIKLELVKIARDLCFNEYTDHRAQLHNRWLVESEHLWRTQRLRLAYPDMPVYPSEADILTRADKLYDYINKNPITHQAPSSEVVTVTPSTVTKSVPEPLDNDEPVSKPEPESVPVSKPVLDNPVSEVEANTHVESHSLSEIESQAKVIELKPPAVSQEAVETSAQSGEGQAQAIATPEVEPEPPKTSQDKRLAAEAKLLELIKEQANLQGMPRAESTTTTRLLPGIINKLNDLKNSLGPPKGGA